MTASAARELVAMRGRCSERRSRCLMVLRFLFWSGRINVTEYILRFSVHSPLSFVFTHVCLNFLFFTFFDIIFRGGGIFRQLFFFFAVVIFHEAHNSRRTHFYHWFFFLYPNGKFWAKYEKRIIFHCILMIAFFPCPGGSRKLSARLVPSVCREIPLSCKFRISCLCAGYRDEMWISDR